VCRHVCGCKIFPVSVSVRPSVPNNGSQQCFLEVTQFGFVSALVFWRSAVTNCLVKKYSAFIEYSQCMSGYLDTCVNVHHCLAWNDFNSSDGFRHRLWWIRVYVFICINVITYLLSKNIGGNNATSSVLLIWCFFKYWRCLHIMVMLEFKILWLTFHTHWI
jgi:hypothetical protein